MNTQSVFIGCCLSLAAGMFSCQPSDNRQQTITLTNQSGFTLQDQPVVVARSAIKALPEGRFHPLLLSAAGDTIPAQLDDLDGDGQWDELFFVYSLSAEDSQQLKLSWMRESLKHKARTSVRFGKRTSGNSPVQPKTSDTLYASALPRSTGFQAYQTDGPSWENDKVGFRHYFDGRNAKDLFGKRTADISPEQVGINKSGAVEDNYHVMADWGRDILAVGNSVGIGGIALLVNNSLQRLGVTANDSINNIEQSVFRITAEGPVRSVINFDYHNWQAGDRTYQVREQTSIWPGMYAFKNTVSLSGLQGNESLLVGLVNSRTEQAVQEIAIDEEWMVLLTHDRQTYEKEWWLGLALILPRAQYQGVMEAPKAGNLSSTYFAKLKADNARETAYYAVAAWELSDPRFRDGAYFRQYVTDLARQLSAKVAVKVE